MTKRKYLYGAIIFAGVFGVGWLLLSRGSGAPYDDGKFYVTLASLQSKVGFIKEYPWLYFSQFRTASPGLHFLYSALLVPFAKFFPAAQASIAAASFFFAGASVIFLALLRRFRFRPAWLWLLLFVFGSADFLFRLLLARPISLSLAVLLGAYYCLSAKKYWLLLPLAFAYVWLYDGYILLLALPLAFAATELVRHRKISASPLLWTIGGLAAGLVINPFFPNNVLFHHFLLTPPLFLKTIQNSREWQPYDLATLVRNNWIVLVVYFVAFVAAVRAFQNNRGKSGASAPSGPFLLLTVSGLFFVLMLLSRRFVEYWVPFSILFSASQFQGIFSKITWPRLKQSLINHWQLKAAGVLVACLLAIGVADTAKIVSAYFRELPATDAYRGPALWLAENSAGGDIVFNPQWDQFPRLFYWDQKNYYIVGLDPTFLYAYSPDLYRQWREISDDREDKWGSPADLDKTFRQTFRARYVFVEQLRNPVLARYLAAPRAADYFKPVYNGGGITVYEAL